MCGFVGSLSPPGRVSNESIRLATASMAHRGPDDCGHTSLSTSSCELKLGFRRLAILDLSAAGHQPMADKESGNWIVFNGEIFNFHEVQDELRAAGIRVESQCDTEVLLKAYGRWGLGCLDRLRGMFAFAVWDHNQQRLVLARDRLGIKPLYYFQEGGLLLFASEVRALLATGLVPRILNPAAIVQYLSLGSVYDPDTILAGVRSLRPGHYAICQQDTLQEKQYWTIPQRRAGRTEPNDYEVREQAHSLLQEAVKLRMISDVPVSVFLSGGIDSSAIVALARQSGTGEFSTFSVVFPEAAYSEAPYSRAVARKFGSVHREVMVPEKDAMAHIFSAIRYMDQPTIDGINTFIISGAVRSHGIKVALSGIGADEVFAGYSTFTTIPAMMQFFKVARLVPPGIRATLARGFVSRWRGGDRTRKLQMILGAEPSAAQAYAIARGVFQDTALYGLLPAADTAAVREALCPLLEAARDASELDPVNQVSFLELRNYVANTLLRDADTMGMAHALEIRQPYLDHKLVEFLFTLPGSYKRRQKVPKWLLTGSLGAELPPQIVHRAKRGFLLPFDRWLRSDLRAEVEGVLRDRNSSAEFLDARAVVSVWEDFLARKTSWSRPWSLYVLKRWADRLRNNDLPNMTEASVYAQA